MRVTHSVIFHIGDFKTGTTAVQSWLEAGGASGLVKAPVNADALAHAVQEGSGQSLLDALLDAVEHLFAATSGPCHAVISSEHFEGVSPDRLADLLHDLPERLGVPLRVIGYVRPHAGALLSRYGESIKIGSFSGSLEQYLDWKPTFWRLRAAPRFERWRVAFGDAFHLRLYDRATFPDGDIRRDLCLAVCGHDPGPLPPVIGNRGLDLSGLRMMRAVHAHDAFDGIEAHRRWAIGRRIGASLCNDPPGLSLRLHKPLAQRLYNGFRRDAAELDHAFFSTTPLSDALFRDTQSADLPDEPMLTDGPLSHWEKRWVADRIGSPTC